jgi:diadenosine tetraphosphatase ApaH/serine/threonine PP2A family protein phosphatase
LEAARSEAGAVQAPHPSAPGPELETVRAELEDAREQADTLKVSQEQSRRRILQLEDRLGEEHSDVVTVSEELPELEPADEEPEVALYHASPRDPVWEYVLWPDQAAECIRSQARRVSLVGHSHVALFFVAEDAGAEERGEARGAQAGAGTDLEIGEDTWLINPGSVGQPRDGDPRAAWMELDTEAWKATYHRVTYEVDRAAEAIESADLPLALARRLYVGQ